MNRCSFIIFGATGDLSKRKLIPAVYHMLKRGNLKNFVLIGAARENIDAKKMLEQARPFITQIDESVWKLLENNTYYLPVDVTKEDDFKKFANFVKSLEEKYTTASNRLIHLAVAAFYFTIITKQCAQTGLAKKLSPTATFWHRIIYEKPFGHDLVSAREINACIEKYFEETQIYRIDHFLTKEVVGNIALIRFTNCVLEPLWNNRFIDAVHIIMNEPEGMNGRGSYYDTYGALKDVVQNHMLQMMALIGMEAPVRLTGEDIRTERTKVLKNITFVDGIRGQYQGYLQEAGVAPDSNTETFVALLLRINNPRWAGVPFYLKTGKKLPHKQTAIYIKFKTVDCLLTKNCPSDPNYLVIQIAPQATFELELNIKKIGLFDQVAPVTMEYCHSCIVGNVLPDAYEVLYEEVMKGELSIGVRFDEIEYAWNLIDNIKQKSLPLYLYEQGTSGPVQLEQFAQKHGMRWRL